DMMKGLVDVEDDDCPDKLLLVELVFEEAFRGPQMQVDPVEAHDRFPRTRIVPRKGLRVNLITDGGREFPLLEEAAAGHDEIPDIIPLSGIPFRVDGNQVIEAVLPYRPINTVDLAAISVLDQRILRLS